MLATKSAIIAQQPYPGLRSFESTEAMLFHGRDRHMEELLRRLSQNRFLAVVGGSGSGKSSLVRAGLLPALYRGYLVGATTRWRIAVMRPGSAPLAELAKALAQQGGLGSADESAIRESSYGIVNAVRSGNLQGGESLLLVVDQFEELFRFRRESADRDGGAEAFLFVSQLLQAADEFGVSIYVVITMRSDFLGDCAQFPGLPEALNHGQYLIPRMTREQRREAITGSLDFFDVTMADRLVQRLLNDAGDDPDQLPVLQHALQQTYAAWESDGSKGEIDLDHYERAGTMQRALHKHAQRVYESTGENRWIAERIFRCLTVDENGRAVRRPAKFERILRVIGAAGNSTQEAAARTVIKEFGASENCFLVWGITAELAPDSVIDISHESLIRKWTTLQGWVRDEAKVVDIYCYLRRDASLYPNDAGLWGDPDLAAALKARQAMGWNEAWAEQYSQGPGALYSRVEEFLELSVKDRDQKQRREVWYRRFKAAAAVLAMVLVLVGIRLYRIQQENRATKAQRALLEVANQGLESEKQVIVDKAKKLQEQINAFKGETDAATLAELERLRNEKLLAEKTLSDREKLIIANKTQAAQTTQEYSDSLNRIYDLQNQLKLAWNERDRAQQELNALKAGNSSKGETSKGPSTKGEVDVVSSLRRQIQDQDTELKSLRAENTRLKQVQNLPVVSAGAPAYSLNVPEYSWMTYPANNPQFGVILGDLEGQASATARLYVFTVPNGGFAPPEPYLRAEEIVKRRASALSGSPCPSALTINTHCFVVSKVRTNSGSQQLGTINIGSTPYTIHATSWTPGEVLTLGLTPTGPRAR